MPAPAPELVLRLPSPAFSSLSNTSGKECRCRWGGSSLRSSACAACMRPSSPSPFPFQSRNSSTCHCYTQQYVA
ncbi:hypothetical protein U1Q18_018194 [Sarracenia purpurea var. burkii]